MIIANVVYKMNNPEIAYHEIGWSVSTITLPEATAWFKTQDTILNFKHICEYKKWQ